MRVQVVVPVGVDVIERQPRRREGRELGLDLGAQLLARPSRERDLNAESGEVAPETALRIDEMRDLSRITHRRGVDQSEVQTDAKAGRSARELDRVGGRRTADHQAGGGQDPLAMRELHRRIDLGGLAKVVGGDDEAVQDALARSRRNAKNSTPSRKRRAITAGLSAISETISPIFEARK